MTGPRILLIDDEAQIRKFLRISLVSQGFLVLEASTGADGLAQTALAQPDLVVLDLGLPDLDGQNVLRELRQSSSVPVLVLSVRASEAEKIQALDGGANDYVTKPFGIGEFMARVRVLLRANSGRSSPLLSFDGGRLRLDLARHELFLADELVTLSRKEFALLALLARSADRVLTQSQLLKEIWGDTHREDAHYLRILIARIRAKLGDDAAAPRYLRTEPGIGYRFLLAEDPPN